MTKGDDDGNVVGEEAGARGDMLVESTGVSSVREDDGQDT